MQLHGRVLLFVALAPACTDGGEGATATATATATVSASVGSDSASSDGTGPVSSTESNITTTASTSAGSGTETDTTDPTGNDSTDTDPSAGSTGEPGMVALPPADGGLDYQLGGGYEPPAGVMIVSRDRNDTPAAGLYNICYVNGFQAQPDEESFWLDQHPDLVLRDGNGDPVIDQDWDEMLLDTSTDAKRTALAEIVGGWIAQCGTDGFDAVEIDNLDSYSRSMDLLSQDDAVAYMALLSDAAHQHGMAIAQKNSTEILDRHDEMGTDFAVAEECSTWDECADYVDVYGDAVLMIEYVEGDFANGCAQYPDHSIVLRDVNLTTPGNGSYVYDGC